MIKHIHLTDYIRLFNHLAKRITSLSGLVWFGCLAWFSPFRLAWVFDGITDNITQWDIDDIHLSELEQSPKPIIQPDSIGFVYSDFTLAENGRQFTNVEGFREIPAFARNGSIIANDLLNQGEFGGVILQLAYNLALTDDNTVYYMWAYPYTDLSGFDQIVIYARASEHVSNVKLQMQDTDGVRGTDGASFAWFDIGTEWEKVTIPVNDMTKMPWADSHPDMSRIQKIDLVFEKNTTQPAEDFSTASCDQ